MAGYNGYSKSNNAIEAESTGKYPLTIAAPMVAKAAGITVKVAREFLKEIGRTEWHHTSKKYNCTNYYNAHVAFVLLRFAKENDLDYMSLAFLKAVDAYGLQDNVDEFLSDDIINDGAGDPQTRKERIAEFVNDVKTSEWI